MRDSGKDWGPSVETSHLSGVRWRYPTSRSLGQGTCGGRIWSQISLVVNDGLCRFEVTRFLFVTAVLHMVT